MSTGDGESDASGGPPGAAAGSPAPANDASRETGALWPAPPDVPPPTPLGASSSPPLLSPRLKKRLAIGGGAALGAVVLVAVIASTCGGRKPKPPVVQAGSDQPDLAAQAADLLAKGDAAAGVDLLEPALAPANAHADGRTYLELGHARFQVGRRLDALGAYEHAIVLDGSVRSDPELRSNITKVLDKGDPVASAVALELLATGVDPPARDTIVAQASTSKLPEVRHRAFAIAERLEVADQIDRVESWSADLRQATTCEERHTAVLRLRGTGDKRALGVLKKAQAQWACIAKEAGEAIASLTNRE